MACGSRTTDMTIPGATFQIEKEQERRIPNTRQEDDMS
jgi:hypothetical protein